MLLLSKGISSSNYYLISFLEFLQQSFRSSSLFWIPQKPWLQKHQAGLTNGEPEGLEPWKKTTALKPKETAAQTRRLVLSMDLQEPRRRRWRVPKRLELGYLMASNGS